MSSHRRAKQLIEKVDNPFSSLDFDDSADDNFSFDAGILGSTTTLSEAVGDCEEMPTATSDTECEEKDTPQPSFADIFSKNSKVSLDLNDISGELEATKSIEAVWDFSAFAKDSVEALEKDNELIKSRTAEEQRRHAEYLEKKHAAERDELKEKAAKLAVSHKQRRRKLDLMKKTDSYLDKLSTRLGRKKSARKRLNKARNSY